MTQDLDSILKASNLRYIDWENTPGFSRRGAGRGFVYLDRDGSKISSEKIVGRINLLAIPPAWKNVWISPNPNTHLQATGKDGKGRLQYVYHPDWSKLCQQNKFNKIVFFGEKLPIIRAKILKDMAKAQLERERILATLVWLLEHTFIRIGNEEYASENHSFGLTTLRNKHVEIKGGSVYLKFIGKSGILHQVKINNPKIVKTIKKCVELPGYELFQYFDTDKKLHVVDSEGVNEYLRFITGEDISAKDFRTWGGSLLGATTLVELGDFKAEIERKDKIKKAVGNVSKHLRNTPKVCINYYIHPTIIDSYQNHLLIPHFEQKEKFKDEKMDGLSLNEFALISLLKKYPLTG